MTDFVGNGHAWPGAASLPGRVHLGAFNLRMNVRKAELVVTLSGLSLSAKRGIETRLAVGLDGLTPADGAVAFPAHPVLSPEGLGIELRGGACYYFFPADARPEHVLSRLAAAGFHVDPVVRRPSKI